MDKSFHAGRVYEPLGNGLTRVKSYADGGALLSDEIMPIEQSVQKTKQISTEQEVTIEQVEPGIYRVFSSFSKDTIMVSWQGLRDLMSDASKLIAERSAERRALVLARRKAPPMEENTGVALCASCFMEHGSNLDCKQCMIFLYGGL